jgi:hypothetical protein
VAPSITLSDRVAWAVDVTANKPAAATVAPIIVLNRLLNFSI